jgi:DNA polymerase I-like protein with 3'-5' exonuclease and polymerase domains
MKDKNTISFLERMEMNTLEKEWTVPQSFPDLTNSKYIAIDLETCDPNLMELGPGWTRNDGFIVGVAVAAGDFVGYYPFRHQGGGNIPEEKVFTWLRKQMDTPHIPKIMHNAMYDAGWLKWANVDVKGKIIDTMIAAPLINENRFSFALNALGRDYLGERKDEKVLKSAAKDFGLDPKKELWKLPSQFVGTYAEQDAALTLRLWNHFEPLINKEELSSIFELETSLIPCVFEMRSKGVRVDLDKAEQTKTKLLTMKKQILKEIKDDTNIDIEPWVATSVAKVFDYHNIHYDETDKSKQASFTKAWLQNCPHPIAAKVLRLRELDKAHNTFIDSILKHSYKGRIHCELHQLRNDDGGTVTGRFSSSNPNLQQIPSRDPEIKKMIRGLFIPEEGEKWGSFDYSSQEPRLLVHYCGVVNKGNPTVDNIIEQYQQDDVDFHQMVADMANISRKEAKTVNLGIMYGMGKQKLANTLDIKLEEANELLDTYHRRVPFVKQLADQVMSRAQKMGRVRTVLGRSCRFDMWEPKTFGYNQPLKFEEAEKKYGPGIRRAFTYKALNRLIQGSAADQTKKAMVDCYKEGLVPLLTVHDELCFSISSQEQADKITEIMEQGLELNVPSKVDQELGDDWGEVG